MSADAPTGDMDILKDTNFDFLGPKISGKVRDIYDQGDKLILITTDRHSSFDRIIAHVPWKGQVLNQVSAHWFEATKDIVPNHVLAVPDPNVTVAKKCTMVPVEAVVRGYLTGVTDTAIWTRYGKGERNFGGVVLPDGMRKNQKLPHPIFDPTTKEAAHDRVLTPEQMIAEGFVSKEMFERIRQTALALFARGQELAARNGLLLGRYQIRVRHRRKRRAGADRRNPYAGFVALLAARVLRGALCRGRGAAIFRQGILAAVVHRTTPILMPTRHCRRRRPSSWPNCRAATSRCTNKSPVENLRTARRRCCRASNAICNLSASEDYCGQAGGCVPSGTLGRAQRGGVSDMTAEWRTAVKLAEARSGVLEMIADMIEFGIGTGRAVDTAEMAEPMTGLRQRAAHVPGAALHWRGAPAPPWSRRRADNRWRGRAPAREGPLVRSGRTLRLPPRSSRLRFAPASRSHAALPTGLRGRRRKAKHR